MRSWARVEYRMVRSSRAAMATDAAVEAMLSWLSNEDEDEVDSRRWGGGRARRGVARCAGRLGAGARVPRERWRYLLLGWTR